MAVAVPQGAFLRWVTNQLQETGKQTSHVPHFYSSTNSKSLKEKVLLIIKLFSQYN